MVSTQSCVRLIRSSRVTLAEHEFASNWFFRDVDNAAEMHDFRGDIVHPSEGAAPGDGGPIATRCIPRIHHPVHAPSVAT